MASVTKDELISLLASKAVSRQDKLLAILAFADGGPLRLATILKIAKDAGLREIENWDISGILQKARGLALNAKGGWTLTAQGLAHIERELLLQPPSNRFTILHHFAGQPYNGRVPYGVLVLHNGVFYGATTYGGPPYNLPPGNPANKGNLFRMNMDGTGFTVLHEFAGGANDGWKPWSGLAITGDTIYGSTVYGGPHGEQGGVLYTLHTDGSGFRLLHTFGEPGDGFGGSTSPALIGDSLYGMTRWGGHGRGAIYSYNITREAYSLLHRF